jgi:hypothetical protein
MRRRAAIRGWRQGCGGDPLCTRGEEPRQRRRPTSPPRHRPGATGRPRPNPRQGDPPSNSCGAWAALRRANLGRASTAARASRLQDRGGHAPRGWFFPIRPGALLCQTSCRHPSCRAVRTRADGQAGSAPGWRGCRETHTRVGRRSSDRPGQGSEPEGYLSLRHITIASAGSAPAGRTSLSGEGHALVRPPTRVTVTSSPTAGRPRDGGVGACGALSPSSRAPSPPLSHRDPWELVHPVWADHSLADPPALLGPPLSGHPAPAPASGGALRIRLCHSPFHVKHGEQDLCDSEPASQPTEGASRQTFATRCPGPEGSSPGDARAFPPSVVARSCAPLDRRLLHRSVTLHHRSDTLHQQPPPPPSAAHDARHGRPHDGRERGWIPICRTTCGTVCFGIPRSAAAWLAPPAPPPRWRRCAQRPCRTRCFT